MPTLPTLLIHFLIQSINKYWLNFMPLALCWLLHTHQLRKKTNLSESQRREFSKEIMQDLSTGYEEMHATETKKGQPGKWEENEKNVLFWKTGTQRLPSGPLAWYFGDRWQAEQFQFGWNGQDELMDGKKITGGREGYKQKQPEQDTLERFCF